MGWWKRRAPEPERARLTAALLDWISLIESKSGERHKIVVRMPHWQLFNASWAFDRDVGTIAFKDPIERTTGFQWLGIKFEPSDLPSECRSSETEFNKSG